jgi:hypothetical protein
MKTKSKNKNKQSYNKTPKQEKVNTIITLASSIATITDTLKLHWDGLSVEDILLEKSDTELNDLLDQVTRNTAYISKLRLLGIRMDLSWDFDTTDDIDGELWLTRIECLDTKQATINCKALNNGNVVFCSFLLMTKSPSIKLDITELNLDIQPSYVIHTLYNKILSNEEDIIYNKEVIKQVQKLHTRYENEELPL